MRDTEKIHPILLIKQIKSNTKQGKYNCNQYSIQQEAEMRIHMGEMLPYTVSLLLITCKVYLV